MKLTKSTYLSVFFLICFVASFGARAMQNLTTVNGLGKYNKVLAVFSHVYNFSVISSDSLLEDSENETEIETETDDVLSVQVFTLPNFIAYFQYEEVKKQSVYPNPLAEKHSNPIYIEICNFRI